MPAAVAGADDYLDELIAQARADALAERPMWRSLGHYRPNLLGNGDHSLIDSPSFFNAGDGKTDPAGELEATLGAFFADAVPSGSGQHPQCAFIARYRWLKSELEFDPEKLPEQPCSEFEKWSRELDAEQVTLIFPAAYFNNPSSMFGHTFLRLDQPRQSEQTRLLSYAVNFGAVVDSTNMMAFAVHGVTGGYPGTYSILPYAALVRSYSDIENRDIWEYQLNLTRPEIQRMLEHLWELQDQYSDYYFFDENCSYQLLFLLDVARPGLQLADQFKLHVIPVDSARAIVGQDGLLQKTVFRPSSRSEIEHRLRFLKGGEHDLLRRLIDGQVAPDEGVLAELPGGRHAALLELAEQFVTYQLNAGERDRDAAAKRSWQLLAARSRIALDADFTPVPEPEIRPDQGHGSARLALGGGSRDGRWFQTLQLRPAYHDHLDPVGGYVHGAEIDVLDVELRHYQGDRSLTLESLTVAGIRSLAPRDGLIQPISWRLSGGLERLRTAKQDEKGALVLALEGGVGPSYALGDAALVVLMAEAALTGGEDCNDSCALALGPSAAVVWPVTDRWLLGLEGHTKLSLGRTIDQRYGARLGQGFGLAPNLALKFEALVEDDGGGAQTEWSSSLHWYF